MTQDRKDVPAEGSGILGAIFGVIVAVAVIYVFGPLPWWIDAVLIVVISAAGWRYGDDAASWVLERLRWLWPF